MTNWAAQTNAIRKHDWIAASCTVAFGVLISTLPHWLAWAWWGSPTWIASMDELECYLPTASQAYHNHPFWLSDANRVQGGQSVYPHLPFIPGILLAKIFGGGAESITFGWRFMAGILMGGGLYLVTRQFLGRPWFAAGMSAFFMADAGFMWARPGFMQWMVTHGMIIDPQPGWFFGSHPVLLGHWRVMNPGISLGPLLLHLFLFERARQQPNRRYITLAGVSLGLLFYTFFYFWTAALIALALLWVINRPERRILFGTAWLGVLVGLPAIIFNMWLTSHTNPDWPQRTALFIPVDRFESLWLTANACLIFAAGFVWTWWRHRQLAYLWALGGAGLLLLNQHVVTGIFMCNGHWGYIRGLGFSLLFVLLAGREWARYGFGNRKLVGAVAVAWFIHIGAGFWFRIEETASSRGTARIMQAYRDYKKRDQLTLTKNAIIAGDYEFAAFAQLLDNLRPLEFGVFLSTSVDNPEWDQRCALNAWLSGNNLESFASEQRRFFDQDTLGPWFHHPELRAARVRSRIDAFLRIQANSSEWIARFDVRYVALPIRAAHLLPRYLGTDWRLIEAGDRWQVWERATRTDSEKMITDIQ